MDEQSKYSSGQLETSKSERAVWLMKCPPVVSRSLQCPPPLPFDASSSSSISSGPVAKVVVSIDPLLPSDDPSSRQGLSNEAGIDRRKSTPVSVSRLILNNRLRHELASKSCWLLKELTPDTNKGRLVRLEQDAASSVGITSKSAVGIGTWTDRASLACPGTPSLAHQPDPSYPSARSTPSADLRPPFPCILMIKIRAHSLPLDWSIKPVKQKLRRPKPEWSLKVKGLRAEGAFHSDTMTSSRIPVSDVKPPPNRYSRTLGHTLQE
ncbi:hypothetical protein RHGRI_007604 [Rhododendron griersonianum]|uniref:Uncharacterized protein n=1 Tax=Rhododendron griersonianum TaxID=479676 RepID=A0AAV6L0D2_9ERIC|nr:hypothetical protein RHGRI_007604 [Rhododendron griersonianum]